MQRGKAAWPRSPGHLLEASIVISTGQAGRFDLRGREFLLSLLRSGPCPQSPPCSLPWAEPSQTSPIPLAGVGYGGREERLGRGRLLIFLLPSLPEQVLLAASPPALRQDRRGDDGGGNSCPPAPPLRAPSCMSGLWYESWGGRGGAAGSAGINATGSCGCCGLCPLHYSPSPWGGGA